MAIRCSPGEQQTCAQRVMVQPKGVLAVYNRFA